MIDDSNDSLLDMLVEVQQLDRVPRLGFALRGLANPESVTEHCWHVAFLVWSLGSQVPGLDLSRSVEIALVHDLAEVRIGDLPQTAARYFPPGTKDAAEEKAVARLTAPLASRAAELLREYQEGSTLESRVVKACDKLQLMIKVAAYESSGAGGLSEFWANSDNFPELGIAVVDELVAELRSRFLSG